MKPIDITAFFSKISIKYTTSILCSFIGIAGLAISHHSFAEDYDLEVVIKKKGEVDESQIAFVPFSGDSDLSKRVFNQLESMPMKVTSEGLIGQPHTREDLAATLPAWQQFGIPYLVIGDVNNNAGKTVVNFQVVEVEKGRIIKGTHTLSNSNKSILANQISARVYELINNKKLDINAQILYVEEIGSGPSKTSTLYLINSDGSNRRLIDVVTDASIFAPAVSPDGRNIVYPVQLKDQNANIYKYNIANKNFSTLVESKGSDISPSFSPDGSTILFSSTREGDADIWRVSSNGGIAERIIGGRYEQITPSYAPNGSFIFASDERNAKTPILYRSDFSNKPTPINNELNATDPNYSLDGTKIGYLKNNKEAAVMDASGRLIKSFGITNPEQAPSISPDGERAAYATGTNRSNIIIRFIEGGKPIYIPTEGVVKSVKWVPSGELR